MNARGRRRRNFSLIELLAVMVILGIVMTLAATRLGRWPAAAQLERSSRELELLFERGRYLAALRNLPVAIDYDAEQRRFQIQIRDDAPAERNELTLPAEIVVEFPAYPAEKAVEYRFAPGGGVDGPEMILRIEERHIRLRASPLTGQLLPRTMPEKKDAS